MNVRHAHIAAIRPFMVRDATSRPNRGRRALPAAPTAGGRLRELRMGARKNQDDMAADLLVDRSMISKYENGAHSIPEYIVERAAQLFGVTPAFIQYGDTDNRMARVVGYVGAGAQVEAIEQPPFRYVEVPASWTDAFALEIRGISCYPIYDDGDDIVIRGPQRLDEAEVIGRMCAVETVDGRGLVKRVRKGSAPGLYTLESPNAPPIEDVAVASARPVKMHFQR